VKGKYLSRGEAIMRKLIVALAIALLATLKTNASAAEITALVATAMKTSIDELAPQFEGKTGHKLHIIYGPSGALTKHISDGEVADFAILGEEGYEELTTQSKIVAGSGVTIAVAKIGAAVPKGSAKPDISSTEAFKLALLAAKSIAYVNPASGGSSAVHLDKVFETMGIAEALRAKTKLAAGGPNGHAGTLAANGEADIAMQMIPELMAVSGIDIVGPLPGEFQKVTTYVASIPSNAREMEGARTLISFLLTPTSVQLFTTKGMHD
jgi:molybdate transport system substrate-binding protein